MHWPAQGRHADRGILADAARPQSRGQGARRRPLQPQRGAAHRGREGRPRRHAAAAVLRHPARVRRRRAAVVRRARYRRHRLQPDAGRPAHRRLHRRARQGAARRRLALAQCRVHRRQAEGQPGACRDHEGGRPAPRHVGAAAAAIAWTLAWPGVSGAIVGAREPSQVDGWIDAATLHLRQADLDEIAETIERTGAGIRPGPPGRDGALNARLLSLNAGVRTLRDAAHVRREGDFLHAAGRGCERRARRRVLPLCRLQSVVGARAGSRHRRLPVLRHRFRRHRRRGRRQVRDGRRAGRRLRQGRGRCRRHVHRADRRRADAAGRCAR